MKKLLGLFVCLMMAVTLVVPIHAENNDTLNVNVNVTYQQTSARSMLDMINKWRNDGTWYYNRDNEKVDTGSLPSLKYDYDLEAIAMKRAAEIAALFEHQEPDGNSIFEMSNNGVDLYGENIAVGMSSAKQAFEVWQENDEKYGGQGHRLNMLGDYNTIGIGHAVIDGVHYWVQDFGDNDPVSSPTVANDSLTPVDLSISKSYIKGLGVVVNDGDEITSSYGDKVTLPDCTAYLKMSDSFTGALPVNGATISWGDTSQGTVNGNEITLDPSIVEKTVQLPITASYADMTANTALNVYVKCKHDQVKYKSVNSTQHKKVCAICGQTLGTERHHFDAGKVTQEATSKKAGTKQYTCKECGYVKKEIIPKKKVKGIKVITGKKVKKSGKKYITKTKKVTLKLTGIKGKAQWNTSNKKIATVKNGKVTFKKKGTVTIKCKVKGKTYQVKITYKK